MLTIAIGIQARLSSLRLSQKSIKKIDGKPIVSHLLDRVFNCVNWMVDKPDRNYLRFDVFLLTPEQERDFWDSFVFDYNKQNRTILKNISGSMDNVFSRYELMTSKYDPNYIVRLTGDCPFVPSPLISKIINIAIKHRLDYISNVDQRFRTMPDGYDCEVISEKAFEWMRLNIDRLSDEDLEHVTTFLRRNFADWMRVAIISTNIDQESLKYSVDTLDDYNKVNDLFLSKINKDNEALKKGFGVYEY